MPNDEFKVYWINAGFPGRCAECAVRFEEGERVLFDPLDWKIYCEDCGEDMDA